MRLIDADSVTVDMPMYNSFSVGMPLEERLKIMLERQPTVGAIPIEWIEEYCAENWVEYSSQHDAIRRMLVDWKEENG